MCVSSVGMPFIPHAGHLCPLSFAVLSNATDVYTELRPENG